MGNFLGATLKDAISNVLAFLLVIGGAANAYFQNLKGEINWFELAIARVSAVVFYITGKDGNAKPKVVVK